MRCPLCQSRPSRRHCPALDRGICAVCCGTGRRVDIRCPESCAYLANAEAHPPAAVRRQQDHDLARLVPVLSGLSEARQHLLLLTLTLIDRARGTGLDEAADEDVFDALGALARTYETSTRGVIYEHRPSSRIAQRVAAELKAVFDDLGRSRPGAFASDAAVILRRLDDRAREVAQSCGGGRRDLLDLVARVSALFAKADAGAPGADPSGGGGAARSSIIVP